MISRQLPVVLQLIFECCEVSDDGFSFLTLLLVGYIGDAAVQIINRTSLCGRSISQGLYCHMGLFPAYQNDGPALMGRDGGEAGLVGGEILRCGGEGGVSVGCREEQSVSLTSLGFVFHDEGNNYVIK